tara:strand:- start:380 stop:2086 length:1707 start_codon:yes stop_codon:yes gene_type:complete
MSQDVLDLFKAVVVDNTHKTATPNTMFANLGLILDFTPTAEQTRMLRAYYKPLEIRTLFSVEERENASMDQLLNKQILHYVEVYGLGMPGLFDLEFDGGTTVGMNYVKGIDVQELGMMVRDLLAQNAPVKDAELVKRIINEYNISYNIADIANNEVRISLFDVTKDRFRDGDDTVRWMCYAATQSALLIKSPEVIAAVKEHNYSVAFLERHVLPLARVFNRHKKLIMAAKNINTRTAINKISRWSKQSHVPLHGAVSKRYVGEALAGRIDASVLGQISVRDKFKFLNLLDYKRQGYTKDAFVIRNGKIHIHEGRHVWTEKEIATVETDVLASLAEELAHLKDKSILLDSRVHYGLPVSRKQTVGNLPFGTRVVGEEEAVSAGIYWENKWGANDLDLSAINLNGDRTGWGQASGYDSNDIVYSGDVTDARNGAMEFLTSNDSEHGLFVNIYSGDDEVETEVVVGKKTSTRWIDEPIIREKTKLTSKGSLLGFVKGTDFIVFQGRMSNSQISGDREAGVVARGTADFWTVNRLFDAIGINYEVDKNEEVLYTNDITYKQFTYNKLEELLF